MTNDFSLQATPSGFFKPTPFSSLYTERTCLSFTVSAPRDSSGCANATRTSNPARTLAMESPLEPYMTLNAEIGRGLEGQEPPVVGSMGLVTAPAIHGEVPV